MRIIRLKEVMDLTGLARETLKKASRFGEIPASQESNG